MLQCYTLLLSYFCHFFFFYQYNQCFDSLSFFLFWHNTLVHYYASHLSIFKKFSCHYFKAIICLTWTPLRGLAFFCSCCGLFWGDASSIYVLSFFVCHQSSFQLLPSSFQLGFPAGDQPLFTHTTTNAVWILLFHYHKIILCPIKHTLSLLFYLLFSAFTTADRTWW